MFLFLPFEWIEKVGRFLFIIPRYQMDGPVITFSGIWFWCELPPKFWQFIVCSHTKLWFYSGIPQNLSFVVWTAFVIKWGIPWATIKCTQNHFKGTRYPCDSLMNRKGKKNKPRIMTKMQGEKIIWHLLQPGTYPCSGLGPFTFMYLFIYFLPLRNFWHK